MVPTGTDTDTTSDYADTHAYRNTAAAFNAYTDSATSDAYTDLHSHADAYRNTDGASNADSNAHPYKHPDTDGNADQDTDSASRAVPAGDRQERQRFHC